MIQKTCKIKYRKDGPYTDKVLTETWWLFGFIPVYSRETIQESNR